VPRYYKVVGQMLVLKIPCSQLVQHFVRELLILTASVVWWSDFLATATEVPGSIPGAARFSE
jgi:hypothetical protein